MSDSDNGGKFRVVYPETVRQEVKELGISLGPLKERATFVAAVAAIDIIVRWIRLLNPSSR